jgi:hypothetical protein
VKRRPTSAASDHSSWRLAVYLDYLISEFVTYYNTTRESLPPVRNVPDEVETLKLSEVVVRSHVGGLVKSLERRAA